MTDDVRSALHELAASVDLPPLRAGELVGQAAGRRRRRRLAAGSAAAAVLLVPSLGWSAVQQRDDVVVQDRAGDIGERTVAVGRAELTVPDGWEVVELAPGEPEGCDLALDQFTSPRLYVARGAIASVAPPCAVDATGSSTVGGLAVALTGSRLEGTREDEDGRPISVNGIAGVLHVDLMNIVHRRSGADVREQVEIRTYVFRAVDVALRLRATPDPDEVDELVSSLRATGPLIPPSPSPAPPSPPPADAGPLPDTLVALAEDVVRLDPATGDVLGTVTSSRETAEGAGDLQLSPDGEWLFYARALTSCSSEIVRVPVAGGPVEVVTDGSRPAISPDGQRLAYWAGSGCEVGGGGTLAVRDLASGQVSDSTLPAAADEALNLASVAWSSDGSSIAVLVRRSRLSDERALLPTGSEVRIVDVAGGASLPDARPLELEEVTALEWRGALGTLVVATGDAVLEVDSSTGTVVDRLLPVEGRISSLSFDPSGRHLLYVQHETAQPGVPPQIDRLLRWSGGEPVPLRAEDVYAADW